MDSDGGGVAEFGLSRVCGSDEAAVSTTGTDRDMAAVGFTGDSLDDEIDADACVADLRVLRCVRASLAAYCFAFYPDRELVVSPPVKGREKDIPSWQRIELVSWHLNLDLEQETVLQTKVAYKYIAMLNETPHLLVSRLHPDLGMLAEASVGLELDLMKY